METLPTADEFTADPAQIVQLRTIAQLHLDEAEKIAGPEGRALKASEQRKFDAHLGEANKFRSLVEQVEFRQAQADKTRERYGHNVTDPSARNADEGIRALLAGEVRTLDVDLTAATERRALSVGTGTAGGNTVPTSFIERLYEHMVASAAIRSTGVTVHTTPDGRDLQIPKTTGHTSAEIVAEGDTIPEDDPTLGEVTLGAWKYGRLLKVSSELLVDSGVNIAEYLARSAGRAIGDASGAHFVSGTGSGQPQGALTASTAGVTANSPTAITADELIDLHASVIPAYRRDGTFMMSDATWAYVRKLTTTDGAYLVGDLASGAAPQLLGRPVVIDPNMPAIEASSTPILWGDFSAYHIRQHATLRFERSDDVAFASDQVWFRALHRMDGRLVDTSGALKHLAMPAS